MKKFLFLIISLILVTSTLCACNSTKTESNNVSNNSDSSEKVEYASDTVRYDCNGYPLNQYQRGIITGRTFGNSGNPYRTQITEIVTSSSSTTIYTHENSIGIDNYLFFTIDRDEINVSRLNVHDMIDLYFDTNGDVTDIR